MSVEVALTSLAAESLARLAPSTKETVGEFLRERLPAYATQHDRVTIPGLEGKYWVVQLKSGTDGPTLMITQADSSADAAVERYVVTAVIPHDASPDPVIAPLADPTDVAIGAEVLRSTEVVE